MCTFTSDREVAVCDVAIGHVKAKLAAELGGDVSYTHTDGRPTLVKAGQTVDAERFRQLVNAGITEAEPSGQP
jgi:hypothetical protein